MGTPRLGSSKQENRKHLKQSDMKQSFKDLLKERRAYSKILAVIRSCETVVHLKKARKMVDLYAKQYPDSLYSQPLLDKLVKKWQDL